MTDLITRLERADGPDRELDADIAKAVGTFSMNGAINISPRYTASVDAALTLVPEGLAAAVLLDAINANQEAENWLYHLPRYIVITALRAQQKDTNA